MGSKVIVFLGLFLVTVLLISSEVEARELTETSSTVDTSKEAEKRFEEKPPIGLQPAPPCKHGCCIYSGGCIECCTYAGQKPADAEPQDNKPQN